MISNYLLKFHREDCIKILLQSDEYSFYSIYIDFLKLFEYSPDVGDQILCTPIETLSLCDENIVKTQEELLKDIQHNTALKVKKNVRARFYGLPVCPELHRVQFPTNTDLGCFLKITGTVTRLTQAKMLEYRRTFTCNKCKKPNLVEGEYEHRYILKSPYKCNNINERCRSTHFTQIPMVSREHCKDYQEIRLQEHSNRLGVGGIPASMWITLEEDLVDKCKPGDDVNICGTVRRRWRPTTVNKKCDIELVFQANYLEVCNLQKSKTVAVSPDVKKCFDDFWVKYKNCPLRGRDVLLSSVCPQVFGLYLAKLALLLTVVTGSSLANNDEDFSKSSDGDNKNEVRGQCHLLLVGDPGTGKSQLLQAGADLTPRSVLTCGTSSTKAGLTCAAIREDGEWQLEAGALVLSDGGACCVDEIGHLPANDRAAIHEAMEQQTISVAKAGIVCKLNTRCAVIAACNPKGKYDLQQPLSVNVSLGTPLLSRFDLIFILLDNKNEEWDKLVSSYILFGEANSKSTQSRWSTEKLQMYIALIGPQNVEVSKSANEIMRAYYMQQRQSHHRDPSRTTVRMLDSLVRLSQAHCKIMYRKKVIPMDAIVAIALVDLSMQDCSMRDSNKALRSMRSKYPDLDYLIMAHELLERLELSELWKEELLFYGSIMQVDVKTLESQVLNKSTHLFRYDDSSDGIDIPLSGSLVTSSYFRKQPSKDLKCDDEVTEIEPKDMVIPEEINSKRIEIETKLAATIKKIGKNNPEKPLPKTVDKKPPKRKRKSVQLNNDSNSKKIHIKQSPKSKKGNRSFNNEHSPEDETFDQRILNNVPSVYDELAELGLNFKFNDEVSLGGDENLIEESKATKPLQSVSDKLSKFKCNTDKDYTKFHDNLNMSLQKPCSEAISEDCLRNSMSLNIKENKLSQISIFDNNDCSDVEFDL